jgi:hypothetical protein
MITTRTAALIAAMSLLGTVTPAAFAEVTIGQAQSNEVGDVISIPIAIGGSGDDSDADADSDVDVDQGACQSAAGADRGSLAISAIFSLARDDAETDCS